MTLSEMAETLEADVLHGYCELSTAISRVVCCDLMSDVLTLSCPGATLLTGLTNPQVVRTAEMAEIASVCFVRGKRPPPATVELARDGKIPLLTTHLSAFEACGRLYATGLRGCKYDYDRDNCVHESPRTGI